MKNIKYPDRVKELFLAARSILMMVGLLIVLHGCEDTTLTPKDGNEIIAQGRRRPRNPPPPPPVFFFTNCGGYPSTITGSIVAGKPTTATATFNYVNSPGGPHPGFTSNVVNGITLSAPAGTLSVGNGSITFTASGTPITPGSIAILVSIRGAGCNAQIWVSNPPPSGNCSDPGTAVGSTGCVDFIYRGQIVKYATVRAGDGKIWLRQNLGSPQVAVNSKDETSFGDYFQWGRWDDGHQLRNSTAITGSSSLQNPSHIPSGDPNFIKGSTAATWWWGTGGSASDTWSGTVVTATNGKDPCVAIGPGWHLPSAAEWTRFQYAEAINDEFSAFESSLKLTLSVAREPINATVNDPTTQNWGCYWSTTLGNNTQPSVFFIDTYSTFIQPAARSAGISCRCMKD